MPLLTNNAPRNSGLTSEQAAQALAAHGPNALPEPAPPSFARVFFQQFLNPLIYILLAAALVSLVLKDMEDALFIGIVLLVNGLVGAFQEYSAGRAANALKALTQPHATVLRDGTEQDIDARTIVPEDLVLLEAGARVPADLGLIESVGLQCDESLLTGESAPVRKSSGQRAFAGSIVVRGRGQGRVVATGLGTEIGKIAAQIARRPHSQPPLIIRMARFTRNIAVAVGVSIAFFVTIGLFRDMPYVDLFMMSVALSVSAIPEGLPVAISVALAIGMRRMARVNVIVRNMPAVESLGSCTMIATDKTGTLTMNELTVTDILLPDGAAFLCETGHDIEACRIFPAPETNPEACGNDARLAGLLRAAALPNEGHLTKETQGWRGIGDTVDVALLTAAHKGGVHGDDVRATWPLVSRIPYESDLQYAASFHEGEDNSILVFVKGAPEALIAMCDSMGVDGACAPVDRDFLLSQKDSLAAQGLKVLAFAQGQIGADTKNQDGYDHRHLVNLTFLGMAGMRDPIRPEVPDAIRACRAAGVDIVMITGDDPGTAAVIARHAGLKVDDDQIVTGAQVRQAEESGTLDALTRRARIYARVEPAQKLAIVLSLSRGGHFVAVTGDGVNDAPALRHAHVGVAMGRKGTDVARESADIILTDDNFASIVAGIREGRVSYANIRKVIFMSIATGAAEVLLFLLAMIGGMPMPLFAIQLLWLNLVTNGIQSVALVCEKAEGDELDLPPRRPGEPIFDRIMRRRIIHSMLVIGVGSFAAFWGLLEYGYDETQARNLVLLLVVLFENFECLNARSERHSIFRQSFRSNPLLILGILAAQGLHIAAMYTPGLSEALHISPVSLTEWLWLLVAASSLSVVMELEKRWDGRHPTKRSL